MPRSYERTPKDEAVRNASVIGVLTLLVCVLAIVIAALVAIGLMVFVS
jgi:hypothetical protein